MLRRDLLAAAAAAAAGALSLPPLAARAQAYGPAQPAPPSYPPVDERSVWLMGDAAPPNPAETARRLAKLTEGRDQVRDAYLSQGAVAQLEARFAALLGKEDCAFLPTGTLANHLAIRVLCDDHRRAVVQADSHVYQDESDAVQVLSGIHLDAVAPGVLPTPEMIATAVEAADSGPYPRKTGVVSIESPVRRLQGRMPSLATVQAISAWSRGRGVRLHLDGARLLLAPPELDLKAYAACFDTVYVSIYKYLDAPFGAVLAGAKADIDKVRALRHLFGGQIYQGWAPALLALASLETFPDRIARSHRAARELFARLEADGRIKVRAAPDASNIFELEIPADLAAAALARSQPEGVRIGMARDGVMPFFVNETILRRPVDDYVRIFLG